MRCVLLENPEVYVSTTLVSQRLKAIFPQRAEKGKRESIVLLSFS